MEASLPSSLPYPLCLQIVKGMNLMDLGVHLFTYAFICSFGHLGPGTVPYYDSLTQSPCSQRIQIFQESQIPEQPVSCRPPAKAKLYVKR